jgi:ribonuclease HI
MYFDGSLTLEGAGAGVLLMSPSGDKLRYALQLHFWATNNVTEYEALLHGIRAVVELGVWCLFIRGDSELVINQVMKESAYHDARMEAYYVEV